MKTPNLQVSAFFVRQYCSTTLSNRFTAVKQTLYTYAGNTHVLCKAITRENVSKLVREQMDDQREFESRLYLIFTYACLAWGFQRAEFQSWQVFSNKPLTYKHLCCEKGSHDTTFTECWAEWDSSAGKNKGFCFICPMVTFQFNRRDVS